MRLILCVMCGVMACNSGHGGCMGPPGSPGTAVVCADMAPDTGYGPAYWTDTDGVPVQEANTETGYWWEDSPDTGW